MTSLHIQHLLCHHMVSDTDSAQAKNGGNFDPPPSREEDRFNSQEKLWYNRVLAERHPCLPGLVSTILLTDCFPFPPLDNLSFAFCHKQEGFWGPTRQIKIVSFSEVVWFAKSSRVRNRRLAFSLPFQVSFYLPCCLPPNIWENSCMKCAAI